jgi:hypothetical protein
MIYHFSMIYHIETTDEFFIKFKCDMIQDDLLKHIEKLGTWITLIDLEDNAISIRIIDIKRIVCVKKVNE